MSCLRFVNELSTLTNIEMTLNRLNSRIIHYCDHQDIQQLTHELSTINIANKQQYEGILTTILELSAATENIALLNTILTFNPDIQAIDSLFSYYTMSGLHPDIIYSLQQACSTDLLRTSHQFHQNHRNSSFYLVDPSESAKFNDISREYSKYSHISSKKNANITKMHQNMIRLQMKWNDILFDACLHDNRYLIHNIMRTSSFPVKPSQHCINQEFCRLICEENNIIVAQLLISPKNSDLSVNQDGIDETMIQLTIGDTSLCMSIDVYRYSWIFHSLVMM